MRHRRFEPEAAELNLIPIMNMVMCLIPAILFGASTVKIGVIEAARPIFGCHHNHDEIGGAQPLNLKVAVEPNGITLSATEAGFEAVVPAAARHIPKGEAELMTLYNHLNALRARYPDEPTFLLTAAPNVPFNRIVSVLDASRAQLDAPRFTSPADFTAAALKRESGRALPLWDAPIFTVAQSAQTND
ncbi:biopolymer transporter ExbD [Myxococcota bacterium]|nr:biopolymer transporter ExbD [Myxococcota bacterium]MBU1431813.1 biopolymer transporter ExbD [Myxococcota bacterium]MBU1899605.1 biopolymer transporter ExbD [Myxococcota bacterium]